MGQDEITCSSTDGETSIIVRRNESAFPAHVTWIASDGDAKFELPGL